MVANSLFVDREIASTTTSSAQTSSEASSLPQQLNVMSAPTHVIIPPTPDATITTYLERERALSEPHLRGPFSHSPPRLQSASTTPTEELDDPLYRHWTQSPKQSTSLLRRLSRGSHRRVGSSPGDIQRTFPDPPADLRNEDEDDIVIPELLQRGMEMLRVTRKKVTKRICWIDPINAYVAWDSKNSSKCTWPICINTNFSICG
jgi:hypothetical protein